MTLNPDQAPIDAPAAEEELAAALDEVIDARQAGQPLDRKEFLSRFPKLEAAFDALDQLPRLEDQPPTLPATQAPPSQPIPERIGPYRIERELGAGGFGVVYQGYDPTLERAVAVKLLHTRWLDQPEGVDRFLREARATARLRHPGIVQLYDYSREGPPYYLTTELVQGLDPCTWCRIRGSALAEKADLVIRIAQAVEHAHAEGVYHRDLKPGNILIDGDGNPHILDFGLARLYRNPEEVSRQSTSDGRILGTLAYMAPEQAAGRSHDADARSDVYSLGVILYELLTGHLPFEGPTHTLPTRIIEDHPFPPRQLNRDVPRDLEAICLKALAKRPDDRYSSAGALARDLQAFRRGEVVEARSLTFFAKLKRSLARRHQDTVVHDWSVLLLLEGITIFAGCGLLNLWAALEIEQLWPYIVTKLVQVAIMLFLVVRFRPIHERRLTPIERQIWTLVPAYYGGFLSILAVKQFIDPSMPLAPVLAVLSGMGFMSLGATIWGWFYVWGAAFFVLAVLIAICAPAGMLLLGAGWFVCLVIGSLHLRLTR